MKAKITPTIATTGEFRSRPKSISFVAIPIIRAAPKNGVVIFVICLPESCFLFSKYQINKKLDINTININVAPTTRKGERGGSWNALSLGSTTKRVP